MLCKGRRGVQCALVNPCCFLLICIKNNFDMVRSVCGLLYLLKDLFCFISFRKFSAFVSCDGLVRVHIVATKLLPHMCAECEQNECHTL